MASSGLKKMFISTILCTQKCIRKYASYNIWLMADVMMLCHILGWCYCHYFVVDGRLLRQMFCLNLYFPNGRCCCHSVFCGMVGHYIECYSIWRWQMLMPSGRCNNHFFYIIKRWQVLLPSGRWNGHYRVSDRYLVDVFTKVADGIATSQFILCYF